MKHIEDGKSVDTIAVESLILTMRCLQDVRLRSLRSEQRRDLFYVKDPQSELAVGYRCHFRLK